MGQLIDRLVREFSDTPDPAQRIGVGAELAAALLESGRATAAREVLVTAHQCLGDLSGDGERARALCALGMVRLQADDYPAALEDLRQALKHVQNTSDQRLEACVQAQVGKVLLRLGDPTNAIDRLTRALTLAMALGGCEETEGEVYRNLSRVYARLDDSERAALYAHRALELARQRDNDSERLLALRILGNVFAAETERYSLLGMPNAEHGEQAIAWYNEALPLARRLGDRREEVWLANNTAHVLRLTGREKEAADLVEDVLRHGTDGLSHTQLALLHFNLGDALLRLDEPQNALEHMYQALRLAEESSSLEHLPKLHLGLAAACERVGDTVQAVQHHKAYHNVERRLRGADVRTKALLAAVSLEKEELAQVSVRLRAESHELHRRLSRLRQRNEVLDDQVRRDPLTGLANRLAFDEWLVHVPRTSPGPISVALLDLDRFKAVNDTFSHLVGDEVLRRVGWLLRSAVRQGDLVARYGGEEFAIVLPASPLCEAVAVCERVRRRIERVDWARLRLGLRVTLSAGVAQEDTTGRALEVADQRLRAAKNAGRNCVIPGSGL